MRVVAYQLAYMTGSVVNLCASHAEGYRYPLGSVARARAAALARAAEAEGRDRAAASEG